MTGMDKECGFCRTIAGTSGASFVYRGDRVAAFMDLVPVTSGHLLVIPVRHARDLSELDPEDGSQMFRVAQLMAGALYGSGLAKGGVNLFLADGEVAGQEVPHVHLHVIPRFPGDGYGPRLPAGYGRQASRDELDRLAEMVRTATG